MNASEPAIRVLPYWGGRDNRQRYVVGFVLTDESCVVLLRKTKPSSQAGLLNGMGGKVEPGESFADAMDREGAEESGLTFEWLHFATLLCNDERHSGEIACFVARTTDGLAWESLRGKKNDVGERFELVGVDDVAQGRCDTIPNLRWLVTMAAAETDRHDWPYLVIEKAAASAFDRPCADGDDHAHLFASADPASAAASGMNAKTAAFGFGLVLDDKPPAARRFPFLAVAPDGRRAFVEVVGDALVFGGDHRSATDWCEIVGAAAQDSGSVSMPGRAVGLDGVHTFSVPLDQPVTPCSECGHARSLHVPGRGCQFDLGDVHTGTELCQCDALRSFTHLEPSPTMDSDESIQIDAIAGVYRTSKGQTGRAIATMIAAGEDATNSVPSSTALAPCPTCGGVMAGHLGGVSCTRCGRAQAS